MLVFLNGEIIKEEDAKISINDLSYQFGFGLFETIKCQNGIPIFFEDHYKRLTQSAKEIGMHFPIESDEVRKWIIDLLKANKLQSARVKIILSKKLDDKFNVSIFSSPLEKLSESYSLISYKLSRDINSISFKHKTTSRADSYFAYKKALEEGFNDVLYINEKTELIECSRANIFLVMEDKIITPLLESGILSGVTRSKVLELAKRHSLHIEEKNVHSLYLNKAKDVFITNAIIGIMPVSRIKFQDKDFFFKISPTTKELNNEHNLLVDESLNQ